MHPHPFSLLVKPVSADCNLRCRYCFYLPRSALYAQNRTHRMSDVVLEKLIKTYMATDQPVHAFCWQGGEPTLAGLDFYTKVTALQKKYAGSGARVSNTIQTNATLITEKMAAFFARNRFLVGCSLDGPGKIHNRHRLTIAGKPTHQAVMKGIETLRRHQVQFNILTLVTRANAGHAIKVYHYLKKNRFHFQQYIPCVEFDDDQRLLPFAVTGEQWGDFLNTVFDAWYLSDVDTVSIQNFDAVLAKKVYGINSVCVMADNCCQYFVVEYNGDVYPCDFFVEPLLKIGNIMEDTWKTLQGSAAYQDFGRHKANMNELCSRCEFHSLCSGGCLKNRMYKGNPPQNVSILCPGLKRFYRHTRDRFDTLSKTIIRRRRQQEAR
ncbi:MAG: anaerobic sulfatase maturase [Desulfotignum sp.]|nr:anaerobic sulfatase maturase [Desulfotignum sp.]